MAVAVGGWLVVVAGIARAEFVVVVLPDTQYYSESYPETFAAQTEWIVAQRQALNIAFVTHVGDIVDNYALGEDRNLIEWQRADAAMQTLDRAPELPYGVALGNHDYDWRDDNSGPADRFVEFFGPQRYAGRTWYGGASPDGRNQFQFFDGDGRRYMNLSLEWEVPDAALAWAQSVLDAHPGMPTMITTHMYLESSGRRQLFAQSPLGNSGQRVFERLVSPNSQVFLVVNGHRPWEAHAVSYNAAGQPVLEMLADYQTRANGGDGWLRLIHFVPEENRIWFETYSPTLHGGLGGYETDFNSLFSIPFDFDARFTAPAPQVPEPATVVVAMIAAVAVGALRFVAAACGAELAKTAPDATAAGPRIVARVQGEPLDEAELSRAIERVTADRKWSGQGLAAVRRVALEQLIHRRLVLAYLERAGRGAGAREIDSRIDAYKREAAAQQCSWDEWLRGRRQTEGELRREMAWQLAWSRYVAAEFTDAALEKYFEDHRREYDGTELRLSQILLPAPADAVDAQVAQRELIRRAEALRAEIQAGKITFAEAARRHSSAPSKLEGGDLGFVSRHGENVEAFSRAAFALDKGQVSPPVVTSFGVHLIQCTDVRPGKKTWQDVREQVLARATGERFRALAEQERRTAKIEYLSQ